MADLRSLYGDLILDHGRRPRNFGTLPEASHQAEGINPLCGDELKLRLRIEHGHIAKVCFEGHGCAISTASASLMTQAVKGLTVADATALAESFQARLAGKSEIEGAEVGSAAAKSDFGKLEALMGVQAFPTRIKCATLAWHTLRAALRGDGDVVSTE